MGPGAGDAGSGFAWPLCRRRVDAGDAGYTAVEARIRGAAANLPRRVDWANGGGPRGAVRTPGRLARCDRYGGVAAAALGLIDKPTAKRHPRRPAYRRCAGQDVKRTRKPRLPPPRKAVRLAPDLVPAASLAGRILGHRLELRRAGKILETAWQASPHPDLGRFLYGTACRNSRATFDETAERLSQCPPASRQKEAHRVRARL